MENIIVFLIVGGIIIFNLVQNYKKEVKKNKERPKTAIPTVIPEETPLIRPFSKKEEKKSIDLQPVYMEEVIEEVNHFEIKKNEILSQINHPMVSEIADEEDISDLKIQDENSAKGRYLDLENSDECKRAFVHSLIFERKY